VPVDGSLEPTPITPLPATPKSERYADMRLSPDGRWLIAIRERHDAADPADASNVANEVIVVAADGSTEPQLVFDRSDFVMAPRFVDTDRIRFVSWDHPNMPWNDTSLIECRFDTATGTCEPASVLAADASFMQPIDDAVISDRSGWWNLWNIDDDGERPITDGDDEIGGPAWVFGLRDHGRLADGRRVWATGGTLHVDDVATDTGAAHLEQLAVEGTTVTAIVRSTERPPTIVRFDADDPTRREVVVDHAPLPIDATDISRPERIEYPTAGVATAYGWYYPPVNSAAVGPAGSAPPLIVMIHGGPTAGARPWFSLNYQFWTTRGFAIVDVDHRGSTGYGTEFRNLLDGNWGVVDIEDCVAAAEHLAAQGLADRDRMTIRGGSAGGFTVLGALSHSDTFAAGACSYGVADLSLLAADTHKFESRYCDRLVGPWPEARDVYEARSPINHLDRFETPLIVFQGLDDKVVPPNQSEMVVDALRAKGIECEYHAYEGEGHGFRRADTIVHQMNAELAFYQRILGL
jgi:dipeptidyl aminopeptidase/acylaminoacyl peptidase